MKVEEEGGGGKVGGSEMEVEVAEYSDLCVIGRVMKLGLNLVRKDEMIEKAMKVIMLLLLMMMMITYRCCDEAVR